MESPAEPDALSQTPNPDLDEAGADNAAPGPGAESARVETGGAEGLQPGAHEFVLPEWAAPPQAKVDARRVTLLNDVQLRVKIELGRTQMLVEDVLKLAEGSVVELDKLAGDPVDVYVNDRLIARGEVLVLNDNFCVRVSEVITRDPHRMSA